MLSEKFNPSVKAEIKAEINAVKDETKAETNAVKAEINAVKDETKAEIKAVKDEIKRTTTHVGQIILSTTLNTADKVKNIYGGNWEAFGAGKVLIGAGSNGGRSFTAGSTGGEYTHTLTINEMPSHTHTVTDWYFERNQGDQLGNTHGDELLGNTHTTSTTSASGSGQAHNNMQPYVVVYMWRRVS